MTFTFPIPGFASVVGLAVDALPGDGVYFAPGGSALSVQPAFFLFGKLFVGNECFHIAASLWFLSL